ncbi:MAG TPA: sulfatase-like hydrolase/transferase, partial [Candidatus Saccharimonadales bacterium]|nr:sulfatase-like hydrolase/transferase [Candidatus Saccharimonadales bacterium]
MTNILVIFADDMRYDTLKYMWHGRRRLLAEGYHFTSSRLNIGLCQPARTGILTGQYSMRHGVLDNNQADIDGGNVDHNNTVGRWVHDKGYATAMIGKYMNGAGTFHPKPTGWDTWRHLTLPDTQDPYQYASDNGTSQTHPGIFQMTYLKQQAISFMQTATQPWFLYLAPTVPHYPYTPRPDHYHKWHRIQWPVVDEEDVSDKPSWIQSLPALTKADLNLAKGLARDQLRELLVLDETIEALFQQLETSSQLSNTVVIFHSDNGIHYYEHRTTGPSTKNTVYDVSIHVPLIIRGPGIPIGSADVPVNSQDVSATISAIAGASPSIALDGVDLRDIINNPATYATRAIPHELNDSLADNLAPHPPGLGVTTKNRKLYRFFTTGTDQYEMYELDNDPNELTNVANDSGHLSERNSLEATLNSIDPYARNAVIPGSSGDYLATPSASPLVITGDIDVRVKVMLNDWTPSAVVILFSKSTSVANQRGWRIRVNTTGIIDFQWSTAGTSFLTAAMSTASGFVDGHGQWVRATMDVDN